MVAKFIEKRRQPRLEKNLPLRISAGEVDFVTETRNISSSGAYCRVSKYIAPLTKLNLTLLIPSLTQNKEKSHKVVCKGVVVRSQPVNSVNPPNEYSLAIFFNHIEKKDSILISQYVNWYLKGLKN